MRRALPICFGFCFLLATTGAALDLHLHESPTSHSSGQCDVCAHLVTHFSALAGEPVSWSVGIDHRPEHAPAVVALTPATGSHHEPGAPRAPPLAAF